jgi:hypothetical protein
MTAAHAVDAGMGGSSSEKQPPTLPAAAPVKMESRERRALQVQLARARLPGQ